MSPILKNPQPRILQTGTSLLEVLVSIVIVALGLLGLAGLQAKMQLADLEAYQRSQAVLLLEDMANRVTAYTNNKTSSVGYFDGPLSVEMTLGDPLVDDCADISSRPKKDNCEWSKSLKGAAEKQGAADIGAIIDARGCLERQGSFMGGSPRMVITVVWRGTTPTVAPTSTCGEDLYNANCPSGDDRCRRAVSTTISTFSQL